MRASDTTSFTKPTASMREITRDGGQAFIDSYHSLVETEWLLTLQDFDFLIIIQQNLQGMLVADMSKSLVGKGGLWPFEEFELPEYVDLLATLTEVTEWSFVFREEAKVSGWQLTGKYVSPKFMIVLKGEPSVSPAILAEKRIAREGPDCQDMEETVVHEPNMRGNLVFSEEELKTEKESLRKPSPRWGDHSDPSYDSIKAEKDALRGIHHSNPIDIPDRRQARNFF
jgi:hypothetical protein